MKIAQLVETNQTSDEEVQNQLITALIRLNYPDNFFDVAKEIFMETTWDSKMDKFMKIQETNQKFYRKDTKEFITAILQRFKIINKLSEAEFPSLESTQLTLITPADKLFPDIDENYDLKSYSARNIETATFKGNHVSILETVELSDYVNNIN